jgi:hypothetical protein
MVEPAKGCDYYCRGVNDRHKALLIIPFFHGSGSMDYWFGIHD